MFYKAFGIFNNGFRPHRGLFFYLSSNGNTTAMVGCVSVPIGDFSFIYKTMTVEEKRKARFRPHRGLFFYLSCPWNPLILQVPFYSLRRKTLDRIFFYGNYLKNAFKVSFYLMRRKLPRNHLYSPHSHIIQLISISGTFTHMRRKTF